MKKLKKLKKKIEEKKYDQEMTKVLEIVDFDSNFFSGDGDEDNNDNEVRVDQTEQETKSKSWFSNPWNWYSK